MRRRSSRKSKKPYLEIKQEKIHAPGVNRTPGQQFRKLLLYPTELQGQLDHYFTQIAGVIKPLMEFNRVEQGVRLLYLNNLGKPIHFLADLPVRLHAAREAGE